MVSGAVCSEVKSGVDKPVVFSLVAQNERLLDVCKQLSQKSGYKIQIDKEWEELQVTISLKDLTLQQSLTRILGSQQLNYAIISDDNKKQISIVVREQYGASQKPDQNRKMHGNDGTQTQTSITTTDDIETVPPDESGKRALTEGELTKLKQTQKKVDPLDLEVVPPVNPGEEGVTRRQLQEIKERQDKISPHDIEAVPPDVPGETLITEGELVDQKLTHND
jgi:YesN/AraC family two-component response regulator